VSRAAARSTAPLALGDDLRRFASLTYTLAATDFKLRFFGSVLGYLWTLMRPLLLFGILYFVFTKVVRFGGDIEHYPVYLLSSIVVFTYFSETTSRAVTSLVERENLLRKMRFPRMIIPLSVALGALFNLALNSIVVLVFALASGIRPRAAWLQIPLLVLVVIVFAVGLAMLLSALYVRFRDMEPIWEVVLQLFFYGSPILYVVSMLPDAIETPSLVNPMSSVMTQMRHAFIDDSAPTVTAAFGGTAWLVLPLGLTALSLIVGLWVFMRETPRFADNL
jgi:ABC-2 type transport system permease protein